jgi:hypothetical protein
LRRRYKIESDNFSALICERLDNSAADIAAATDDHDLHSCDLHMPFYTMAHMPEQPENELTGRRTL